MVFLSRLSGIYLIDHPQIAGPAGVAVILAEMVELLTLPDGLQVFIKKVAHFYIRQKTTGSDVPFPAHIGIIECFETVFPGLMKFSSQKPVKKSNDSSTD